MLSAVHLFFLSSLLLYSAPVISQPLPRTITVTGQGVVSAPPDTATINTGVVTTAPTAQQALNANNQAVRALLRLLAMQNIPQADIQTSFFSVDPRFANNPDGSQGDITGYRVSNDLRVIIRNIDILGVVLDALVDAGSNNISGVSFSIENDTSLRNRARRLAVQDATRKAKVLAAAAKVRLGALIAISEQSISPGPQREFSPLAAASVPVATGALDVVENVFLQFKVV